MASESPAQQQPSVMTEDALAAAVRLQHAGELQKAVEAYQLVLQVEPANAIANQNMGVLAVQLGFPEAALSYFGAALNSDPTQGECWLKYIATLHQLGKVGEAKQVLLLARQQGLAGNEVDALELALWAAALPEVEVGQVSSTAAEQLQTGRSSDAPSLNARANPTQHAIDTLLNLFKAGRFEKCASGAFEMVRGFPTHWIGWRVLGVAYQHLGRNADALLPMQKTVELLPHDADAHNNLGIVLQALGRFDEAEASYRRALELAPGKAQVHGNLGAVLKEVGRLEEAEASCRHATKLNPKYAKAYNNLGGILHDLKRLDDAEAAYRHALQINPDYDDAHNNLGITLKELGRTDEAEATYRRALEINPNSAHVLGNLSIIELESGRLSEAESHSRQALELEPSSVEGLNSLGAIMIRSDRLDDAAGLFLRALQIKPDSAVGHSSLGKVFHGLGRVEEAAGSFRRALQIDPSLAVSHVGLAVALNDLGQLAEAEASCRRALEIKPNSGSTHNTLGCILVDLQRQGEAEDCFRHALEIEPDFALANSNLLFLRSMNPSVDRHMHFSDHLQFGNRFEAEFRDQPRHHANSRDPDRCLRIGFVSADFRNHALARFIEPLFAELSKFSQIGLHAYSNYSVIDDTTRRLRSNFAHWQTVASLTDDEMAERIRGDGIDILVDLSGHTAHNRLLVFARKPSPLQVSWMGYPGTTGLSAMDYFLADRFLLPYGQFDDLFIEKIVRLPAGAPFLPEQDAPPVGSLPAIENGYLTLGSFNRMTKVGPAVIMLWSQLLRALPSARMLVGGIPEATGFGSLIEAFAREGVSSDRLEFHERCDMKSYLNLHRRVDICLDTFPYNGGTTTLHALWMGVPTLSLAGNTVAGRSGACLLGHVGLDDFVASDEADFVKKGLSWADNLAELAEIRAGLRSRFQQSAESQPALVAASLELALRTMWQRWCAGQPPESFEVTREDVQANCKGTRQ